MRLIGAVLSSLVIVSLAAAEPAKQAAPKDKAKPASAKRSATKPAKPAKATTGEQKETAPKPNPVSDSYAAIPFAERLAIQSDLAWTGDYNGLITGEFND